MKRIVVLVTAVILCLSVLSGCGEGKPKCYSVSELPEGTWRDSEVNAVTYVDNNFIAAAQGNTHYYVSDTTVTETDNVIHHNSDACIYREDMTGEHEVEKMDISGEWRWINPVGDYIFYVNCYSGGMIYGGKIERYDMVKKQTKVYEFPKLGEYKYNNLFVVGEQMYFTSNYYKGTSLNERICRADLDGRNAKILKEGPYFWLLGNDEEYIYYNVIERDENDVSVDVLYALSLDGEEDRELFSVLSDDYWSFSVAKDSSGKTCIYGEATSTYSEDRDYLLIYNVEDATRTKVNKYEIDTYATNYRFEVESSNGVDAYFTYKNADDNISIGKFDHENLATVQLADTLDDRIENVSVVGDYVYYTTDKNVNGSFYEYIHRVKPDGSVDDITKGFER